MERIDLMKEFLIISEGRPVLGDPDGQQAYGYLRVSSTHQAEEGSSGLPRQLQHIHKTAQRERLSISFDMLFMDDGYSGFEFVDRPAFTRLRHELRSNKRADHLVVEDIDRLSRNADWHQGYLLSELARRQVEVHFYSKPGSELERFVRGYMAQETMKKEIERMRLGKIYKAMDGRVTATRPAYGYSISDPKDSHYVINEDEAKIVRLIFDWLSEDQKTLWYIADKLNEMGIPGTRGGKWSAGTLFHIVKNEVYKGWYITNRRTYEVVGHDDEGKPKRKWRTRPQEEWIRVPVPAIVSEEQWQEAQTVMASNRKYATRNSDGKTSGWLLSGLVECSICRYQYRASRGGLSIPGEPGKIRYYHCGSRWSAKAKALGISCRSPYVHADVIEATVWSKIEEVIYHPKRVLKFLEASYTGKRNAEYREQIEYLNSQISTLNKEKIRWDAAYARGILNIEEYDEKARNVRDRINTLEATKEKLESDLEQLLKEADLEEEVERRLSGLRNGLSPDLPLETKRKILTILIDKIEFNSEIRRGTIYGAIPATIFDLSSTPKSQSHGWYRSG
jgi:site-specific DNA recombinase